MHLGASPPRLSTTQPVQRRHEDEDHQRNLEIEVRDRQPPEGDDVETKRPQIDPCILVEERRDEAGRAKVVMLCADGADVPDPWGLPPSAYREMFDMLHEACATLVEHVRAGP